MTQYLKLQVKNYLKIYNSFLLQNKGYYKQYNLNIEDTFYIPNNNYKMYCIVIKNTMYFFTILDGKLHEDFYIKLGNVFDSDFFFEGYKYGKDYKITDVLMKDKIVVTRYYKDRYNLLLHLINDKIQKLTNLNNKISISMHYILSEIQEGSDYDYLEHVCGFQKRNVKMLKEDLEIKSLIIVPGKHSDVYNAYDPDTMNPCGILYIKTINDSKELVKMFTKTDEKILLKCRYNIEFNKFQYISK